MKQFACGDVVPGCGRVFLGTAEQILEDVVVHARTDHALTSIPEGMLSSIREHMRVAA